MSDLRGGQREHDRLRFLVRAFAGAFLFFIGLFFRYQVLGSYDGGFVQPAFSQRQKGVAVTLARGNILDRHGVALHYPTWGSALVRFPEDSDGEFPSKVARSLTAAQIVEALSSASGSGLVIVPEEIRYGPGSLACHVVGHVRPNAYMDDRDNVGESGLEKAFQRSLTGGSAAWSGVVATAEGEGVPGTGLRIAPAAKAPRDIYTTIDAAIQQEVEKVLDQRRVTRGAVVVLDAMTSEVLAMASRPEFDQNHPELSLNDVNAPFVNRAVSAFTPGSVFKPVIAALALELGYVSPDEVFTCTGEVELGNTSVACGSTGKGHGAVTVREALALSCNSALIQMGLRVPPGELLEFVRKSGFGAVTALHLEDEAGGTVPDGYWMYDGDIANTCIGQGRLSATPVQVAAFFAAIAGGGVYRAPRLLRGSEVGTEIQLFSRATAAVLQEALLLGAKEGTGKLAWVPSFGSAGKTGTAETGRPGGAAHAWFCGWTPVIAPRYVIAVFVEEGGDGPSVAAPIFKEIGSHLLDTHVARTP